jgi:GR25 family glycosyltransferase involved in LPS biosynthesis
MKGKLIKKIIIICLLVFIIYCIFYIDYNYNFNLELFDNPLETIPTYIINSSKYPERYDNAVQVCNTLNIKTFERFEASYPTQEEYVKSGTKMPHKGQYGCALSHTSLWKKFIQSKKDYCLILEDDIALSTKEPVDKVISEIQKGYVDVKKNKIEFFYLGSCYGGECAHAYILSKEGAHKLLNIIDLNSHLPFDTQISQCKDITKQFTINIPNDDGMFGDGLIKQNRKNFKSTISHAAAAGRSA